MTSQSDIISILEDAIDSNPSWRGARFDVVLDATNWRFVGKDARRALQAVGERFGCHVCGRKIEDCPEDQKWDADHQPPVGLSTAAQLHYGVFNTNLRLYPQCKPCSKAQSALIRAIKTSARTGWKQLSQKELALISRHDDRGAGGEKNYISTTGTVANSTEIANIQTKGAEFGCHSCGTSYPVTDYEADHVPPATLYQYTWIQSLLARLGIAPTVFKIRPACPTCQRSQGGETITALKAAASYIYQNNLNILITSSGYSRTDPGIELS